MASSVRKQQLLAPQGAKFFKRCLHVLPERFCSQDQQRLALLYFLMSGMDSLSAINDQLSEQDQRDLTDYIYDYLVAEDGGLYLSTTFNRFLEHSHITATYSGIICLLILGDDLRGIHRRKLLSSLKKFQNADGSVCCTPGGESDMRFMFCLFTVYYILKADELFASEAPKNLTSIDIKKSLNFIKSCQTYEGGFAQLPGLEAHGGSTFCALSCLIMAGEAIPNKNKLLQFLVSKQEKAHNVEGLQDTCGFQGRTNKIADTCYTFWVGSSLRLLKQERLIKSGLLENFLYECQQEVIGGFNKNRGMDSPDPLHSCLALLGAGNFPNIFNNQVQPTVGKFSATFSTNEKISRLIFENEEDFDENFKSKMTEEVCNGKVKKNQKPFYVLLKSLVPKPFRKQKSWLSAVAIGLLAYAITLTPWWRRNSW